MNKNNHGFTLPELIVAMAVFTILVALAAPSFSAFTDSSRRASEVSLLSRAFSYARSEAIKHGGSVSICAQTDGAETCSGVNDWSDGWMVFNDTDNNGVFDAGETLLRLFKPIASGSSIIETSTFAPSALTYRGSGFITATRAEFKYCGHRGATDARAIIVSKTGNTRLSIDSNDADKTHEDSTGSNLTCA